MFEFPVPLLVRCGECGHMATYQIDLAKRAKVSKVSLVKCFHCGAEYKIEMKWNKRVK